MFAAHVVDLRVDCDEPNLAHCMRAQLRAPPGGCLDMYLRDSRTSPAGAPLSRAYPKRSNPWCLPHLSLPSPITPQTDMVKQRMLRREVFVGHCADQDAFNEELLRHRLRWHKFPQTPSLSMNMGRLSPSDAKCTPSPLCACMWDLCHRFAVELLTA